MNQMNVMPLVSIVTPAYNAEKFIETTLKSVKLQTYPSIEHIVIDDGSTDNTGEILGKYEGAYNLKWFSKSNEGQAITLNKGFKIAKGEIIVWLNADDVLFSSNVIRDLVEAFKKKAVGVVYGHMAIIDERNRILKIQYAPPKLDLNILLSGHFAACIFYRKEVISRYYLNPTIFYALDYEQSLKMARDKIRFGYINKPLIGWRRHKVAKSLSGRKDLQKEVKQLKKEYGADFGFRYCSMKAFYSLIILARKIYGVKEAIELYNDPKKFQLAYDVKFDSLPKLIIRQAVPYV